MHPLGTALNHFATAEFWFHYRQLTPENRALADRCVQFLQADPRHPSLRLKQVGAFWSRLMQNGQNYGEKKGDRHNREKHELKNRQPKISANSHALRCCTAQGRLFARREFAYA
jgi:hypothetical protein